MFKNDKINGNLNIQISISVPYVFVGNSNVTLLININKNTIEKVSDDDELTVANVIIDAKSSNISFNFTGPQHSYTTLLNRKVSMEQMKKLKLDKIPGFRQTWYYDTQVETPKIYSLNSQTKQFVRCTINFISGF